MEELKKMIPFISSAIVGLVVSSLSANAGVIYFVILQLFYLSNGKYNEAILLVYLIFVFSDSRSNLLSFAGTAKVFLVLSLPYIAAKLNSRSSINGTAFIPFVLYCFVLVLFSEVPFTSFQKTLSYSILLISSPLLLSGVIETYGKIFFKKIIVLFALILFIGLVLILINYDFVHLLGRYRGLLGNPNGLGIFGIVFFLLFQAVQDKYPNLFSKKEIIVLGILFVLSLIYSGSRSAIFTILLFYGLRWIFIRSASLGIFVSIVSIALINFVTIDWVGIIQTFGLQDYFRVETLSEGSGRLVAWTFAWEQIQENILWGNGFAYNEYIFGKYMLMLSNLGHQGNVHNSFLTLWLDTGLFGLLLFLVPLLRLVYKASLNTQIAIPIFICFVFSANFESWMAASLNPFSIIFYFTIYLMVLKREVAINS